MFGSLLKIFFLSVSSLTGLFGVESSSKTASCEESTPIKETINKVANINVDNDYNYTYIDSLDGTNWVYGNVNKNFGTSDYSKVYQKFNNREFPLNDFYIVFRNGEYNIYRYLYFSDYGFSGGRFYGLNYDDNDNEIYYHIFNVNSNGLTLADDVINDIFSPFESDFIIDDLVIVFSGEYFNTYNSENSIVHYLFNIKNDVYSFDDIKPFTALGMNSDNYINDYNIPVVKDSLGYIKNNPTSEYGSNYSYVEDIKVVLYEGLFISNGKIYNEMRLLFKSVGDNNHIIVNNNTVNATNDTIYFWGLSYGLNGLGSDINDGVVTNAFEVVYESRISNDVYYPLSSCSWVDSNYTYVNFVGVDTGFNPILQYTIQEMGLYDGDYINVRSHDFETKDFYLGYYYGLNALDKVGAYRSDIGFYSYGGNGTASLTDVFIIVGSGLSGLTGLFDTMILPGISLGLLIFMPLLFTILLFVIKLFKR